MEILYEYETDDIGVALGHPLPFYEFVISEGVRDYINNLPLDAFGDQCLEFKWWLNASIDCLSRHGYDQGLTLKVIEKLAIMSNYIRAEFDRHCKAIEKRNKIKEEHNAKVDIFHNEFVPKWDWWLEIKNLIEKEPKQKDKDAIFRYYDAKREELGLPSFDSSMDYYHLLREKNKLKMGFWEKECDIKKKELEQMPSEAESRNYPFFPEDSPFYLKIFYDDICEHLLDTRYKENPTEEEIAAEKAKGQQETLRRTSVAIILKNKVGKCLNATNMSVPQDLFEQVKRFGGTPTGLYALTINSF